MKFAISTVLAALLATIATAQSTMRERVLREAAIEAGLQSAEALETDVPAELVSVGEQLFNSTLLSLNGDTSCASCHLDQFGSADGLRVAVGVGGVGEGTARAESGGDIVPRNTLPLWGRGGPGFDTFFWDGKVQATDDGIFSQFHENVPSDDPLVVAAHLPIVQISEMLVEDDEIVADYRTETVASAQDIYERVTHRIREDQVLGSALARARHIEPREINFIDIAESLAAFIRSEFQIRSSPFSEFVFEDGELSAEAIHGGLLFYGKGRCSSCHNGPYFSDLQFHVLAVPQEGFGMNGFGVDYGRYNATLRPSDMYRYRTPPLWQVTQTSPYSHSGAVDRLDDMIRYHFDPLFAWAPENLSVEERVEFARRLTLWGEDMPDIPALSSVEVDALVEFLTTLEMDLSESSASESQIR